MAIIAMKFGGTSVADLDRIRHVATLVKREVEEHVARICEADPYLRRHPARIEWILDADCAEVPAGHPFVTAFQGAVGASGRFSVWWPGGAYCGFR